MELNITYRHLESTPSIEEQIRKKAKRLKKYFDGKIYIDWKCSVDRDAHHSEVTVSWNSMSYHASSAEDSLYKTIDDVIHKLERQLERKDQQVKDKLHRKH